jgi:hypothetical protein
MMLPERLPDGRIRIPVSGQVPGGVAHGVDEIGPDDPRFDRYDAWLRQQEQEATGVLR